LAIFAEEMSGLANYRLLHMTQTFVVVIVIVIITLDLPFSLSAPLTLRLFLFLVDRRLFSTLALLPALRVLTNNNAAQITFNVSPSVRIEKHVKKSPIR